MYSYSKAIFFGCISLYAAYLASIYYYSSIILKEADSFVWEKIGFLLNIGFGGFLVLEQIEYIEHYGLIYRNDKDKKEINELSSWNTDVNMLYNWIVFRFQRHSDHHMNAYKYFTTLEYTTKMPKYPLTFQ